MWSQLFVNVGVILLPMLLYQVFAFKLTREEIPQADLALGLYGGITAVFCQLVPVSIDGAVADFQAVPILLALTYGRRRSGILALTIVFAFRIALAPHVLGGLMAVLSILLYSVPAFVYGRKSFRLSAKQRIRRMLYLAILAFLVQVVFLLLYFAFKGPSPWAALRGHVMFLFFVLIIQAAVAWFSALVLEHIFESQQVRRKLLQSEKALRNAQRIAKLGSWDWNVKWNRLTYSSDLYHLLAVDPARLGNTFEQFLSHVHLDDRQKVADWVAKLLQDDKNACDTAEFRWLPDFGSTKRLLVRSQVMFDEQGQPYHCAGTMQDVTDQKQIENLLKESEQRYRSLVKYNPMGVCALDTDGRFVLVNASYERITGYSSEELLGQSRLDLWYPNDYPKAEKLMTSALQGDITEDAEITLRHKDGHPLTLTTTNVPIVINDEIVGYFTILRDLTETKVAEELLRKSEKLSAVGQLAAGVAHEIRNPLTAIKGFLQLLQHELPTENTHYLNIILNELTRIELISSELLILAKPQAEEFKPHSIQDIVENVMLLLNSQAILHNVELVQELSPDLPEVMCEANQIKQVFINGIKNAIDALPHGGKIQLAVRASGLSVIAQIKDNGVGISSETLRRLGEPFYTTKANGTGLGLMVTHKIIERHGGSIEYESTEGEGTTVTISFPAIVPAAMPVEEGPSSLAY